MRNRNMPNAASKVVRPSRADARDGVKSFVRWRDEAASLRIEYAPVRRAGRPGRGVHGGSSALSDAQRTEALAGLGVEARNSSVAPNGCRFNR